MNSAAVNIAIDDNMKQPEKEAIHNVKLNLTDAEVSNDYIIKDIIADDEELKDFLFTLGCFKGETLTLISILSENYVISVKDARYSIDTDLAKAIVI